MRDQDKGVFQLSRPIHYSNPPARQGADGGALQCGLD
jgi:hypothetical protein